MPSMITRLLTTTTFPLPLDVIVLPLTLTVVVPMQEVYRNCTKTL